MAQKYTKGLHSADDDVLQRGYHLKPNAKLPLPRDSIAGTAGYLSAYFLGTSYSQITVSHLLVLFLRPQRFW